ncbi:hypothetical protein SK069_13115 [Patulibacter brassicae]|uniref:SPOR domain-containing protein n=1 Tax=Patulibacter brassicae TaxID=1705717 RepID=A0ABU4VP37_9ACTN|nr:hypothetical protein [Patulibacter brassicae]MDX8152540.1 hypothetical protein [Patulibacter brassicae]
MAEVRLTVQATDAEREQVRESLGVADDVVAVRPLDDGSMVLRLAGYDRPQAESRAQEVARTAAAAVGLAPTAIRVDGEGWSFGEDGVDA